MDLGRQVLLLALVIFPPGPTLPQRYDFIVAPDRIGDFGTIQDAVNACRDVPLDRTSGYISGRSISGKLVIPAWKRRITIVGKMGRQHHVR
jgi:pectinesterase